AADRTWVIQCKREKSIGPRKLKKIVSETFPTEDPSIHGFIIAAACNFQKPTRDLFDDEMRRIGIQEYQLWVRGELEDMLLRPRHDRTLFTFFGISTRPPSSRDAVLANLRWELRDNIAEICAKYWDIPFTATSYLEAVRNRTKIQR